MLKDLRQKSSEDLKLLVVQLRARQTENRFKLASGELDKTHFFKDIRKLLAQTLTVLHERNDSMTTADWHKFNKILVQQQAELLKKQAEEEQAKKLAEAKKPKKAKIQLKEKETTSQTDLPETVLTESDSNKKTTK